MTTSPLTTPEPATVATDALEPVPMSAWLPGYLALPVIWGSSFLLIKVGVRELHPLYLTLGRVALGALTLLAILVVVRKRLPRGLRVWGHLAVVGMTGVALPFTLFGFAELEVSSVLAGIWNATTPLIALPMAVVVFRTETLTARRAVGLVLGFVGVLVILGVWQGGSGSSVTGQLMCLGAAACYGFTVPYQRRFLTGRAVSGVAVSAGQLIMATLQLTVVSIVFAGAPPSPSALSVEVWGSVLALGVLGTGIAFAISFRIIRLAGGSTAASVTYLMPIVSTVVGILVLDEQLAWYQPVGAFVVLAGVAIAQGAFRRRRLVATAEPVITERLAGAPNG